MKTVDFIFSPRQAIDYIKKKKDRNKSTFIKRFNFGLIDGISVATTIFFIKQYNLNFKLKYYIGTIPILSVGRLVATDKKPLSEKTKRESRIYINIGSLPFYDNNSGIPRVAKEITRRALKSEKNCYIPIYPDPKEGVYRIAKRWIDSNKLENNIIDIIDDEIITVKPGDWLIHTMVNSNELAFMNPYIENFKKQGGKVGAVLHDLIPEQYPEFYSKRDVKLFKSWLSQVVKFDKLFAVSYSTKNDFLKWVIGKGYKKYPEIGVFHLGADFKLSKERSLDLPKELCENKYFLQVSTIEPRKGYEQLLKAFEILWKKGIQINLVIVGRRGWKVREFCKYLKSHKLFNAKLFWYENANDDFLHTLYKNAYAVTVTSKAEGFGLSVCEALFYKKIILARDIPVFHEIAGNNARYFNGDRPEDIEKLIIEVISGKTDNSINYEISDYSWDSSFKQFENIIYK